MADTSAHAHQLRRALDLYACAHNVAMETPTAKMEAYKLSVVEARRKEVELAHSRSSFGKPVQIQTPLGDLLINK